MSSDKTAGPYSGEPTSLEPDINAATVPTIATLNVGSQNPDLRIQHNSASIEGNSISDHLFEFSRILLREISRSLPVLMLGVTLLATATVLISQLSGSSLELYLKVSSGNPKTEK
ncbi:hypothetical protein K9N68_08940 [Kovacikia minuta CCNUW1]|uniref:hypothetical protein n=1 Tax=Kovacikia minuta TaxID=2931930 RepID=UPI001CCF46F4|nr:hypothetical protein [Kovacikia minuta]UBF28002.1 hypothetical protein K9N68_08940 [Kovacikia minuta CCNUW1]